VSDVDFYLEVENRNQILIKVVGNFVSNLSNIKVYAVSEGRSESIKVSLKQGESCPKKKMPTLSSGYVITEADFSHANQVQSDRLFSDGHYGDNRASDRYDNFYMPKKSQDLDKLVKYQRNHVDEDEKSKKSSLTNPNSQTLVVLNDLEKALVKDNPQIQDVSSLDSQTKKEPLPNAESKLTPLEIGMYVLIAVFCVGISVFLINCIVFMVRHKKKRKIHKRSHKDPVYQAKDWVWIGRATLERSSVKTECSQSLMPAEDFNGNHTSHLRSTSSQSRSSSSRGNSANSSNRNSFVSTIKGSECSIRITANPLSDDTSSSGGGHQNSETASQASNMVPQEKWDYEAMGLSFDQLADYFDNLKESSA
jgi:transmembrane protein 132